MVADFYTHRDERLDTPLIVILSGPSIPPLFVREYQYKATLVVQSDSIHHPAAGSSGGQRTFVLGTRGSALALHQANFVAERFAVAHPDRPVRIQVVSSEGDIDKDSPLTKIGGRGVFTSSLQAALTLGQIDAAVHSSKDVPSLSASGLALGAFPQREDPRDVVVSRHSVGLLDLPPDPVVGTSSRRRAVQVLELRPDATIIELRGNIDTRLKKALAEPYDAVILAAAGLARMGWLDRATEVLSVDVFTPAPGQGALAIETRSESDETLQLIAALDDARIRQAIEAERSFLRGIGGGCTTPLGAHAAVETLHGQAIVRFHAMLARDDGTGLTRLYGEWPLERANQQAFDAAKALVRDVNPNRIFGAGIEQSRQLRGMKVIVTGTDELAAEVCTEIERRDGEAIIAPTIRITPPDDPSELREAEARLHRGEFDHVVFTSRQAVKALEDAIATLPVGSIKVAAIGEATAAAVRERGLEPDTVSKRARAEGMLEALLPEVAPGARVLLPISSRARPVLADGLRAHGADVTRVDAYGTHVVTEADAELLKLVEAGVIGAVMLASPSAVEGFIVQMGHLLPVLSGATFVAIGAVTANAMLEHGLPVHAMPESPGATEMVEALASYLWGTGKDADIDGNVTSTKDSQ